jgi:hypothetical protein
MERIHPELLISIRLNERSTDWNASIVGMCRLIRYFESFQTMSAEQLYKRNLGWAYLIKYDLDRTHSRAVVNMLTGTADHLLVDAQTLSIALRTVAAHHEDRGVVLIANAPQRSKFIIEFTLLISNVGREHGVTDL